MFNKRLLALIFLLSLLFFYAISINASIYYSEIFTTNEGASISVSILPDVTTNFRTDRSYSFSVEIISENLLPNQIEFNDIYIQLRIVAGNVSIFSELKGPYQIDSINDFITADLLLKIPNNRKINSIGGQTIPGFLQLKVDFKAVLLFEISQIFSSGWKDITKANLNVPDTVENILTTTIGAILVIFGFFFSIDLVSRGHKFYLNRKLKQ